MDIRDKPDSDILKSLLAEAAKSRNELNCCQQDAIKAQNRLSFILVLINELLEREQN